MSIDLNTVNLVAPALRNKTFLIGNSAGLDETSEIKDSQTLFSFLRDLARGLEEIDFSEKISIIRQTGSCQKESTICLGIKKGDIDKPGDAALFTLTINEKPPLSEFKYGLVKHQNDRFQFTKTGYTQSQDGFFTAGEIRGEFKKFLEFALPAISKWDLECAGEEFHSVCSPNGELSARWARRAIASLVETAHDVEIDGEMVDGDTALSFANEGMVKAVKLGPDTFELVSAE